MIDSKFAFKKQKKYYIKNVNYKRKKTLVILNLKDTSEQKTSTLG